MQSQTQNRRIRERHDARTGWAFMAPFFIMFLLVFAVPICVAIYQSFFRQVARSSLPPTSGRAWDES